MPEIGHYVAGLKKYLDPLYFVRVPSRHPKDKIVMRARNYRQIMTSGCEELIWSSWKVERFGRRSVANYEDGFHHD